MKVAITAVCAAVWMLGCSGQGTIGGAALTSSGSPDAGTTTAPNPPTQSPTPTDGGTVVTGPSTPTDAGTPTPSTPTSDPLTVRTHYQVPPGDTAMRSVPSSNAGGTPSLSAYAYSVLPADGTWSALATVPYPIADLANSSQFATGSFTDDQGVSRTGYRFTIAPGDSPDWGGAPRVEFDSAAGSAQNPSDGMPSSQGWGAGVVTSGMEMWFSWSMYLSDSFSNAQQWCTLWQLHPGNTNYDSGSSANAWPNPGWPTLSANGDTLGFGLGPDTLASDEVWTGSVTDYRGKWTDFAVHAVFSTGSDGLLELYVNGVKVGARSGANLVYATTGGTPPWYYMKQGYYRAANVGTTDTVYQTPVLVSIKGG